MDWSLLGCGAGGHVTFAPDDPALRERFYITAPDGEAWRCLRCGTFVIGPSTIAGPVTAVPRVRRDKEVRSALILRIFAVERFLRALLFAGLAIGIWRFSVSRLSLEQAYERELPAVRTLLRQLGFNVNHNKLLGVIQHAFTLNSSTLALLAILAAGYAVLEVVEGIGLWLLKRWGEYFAAVATAAFIPYEIYDLTTKVTPLRVAAFLVNVALVIYLVLANRLFGARGGKKAYEAMLHSESILDAEIAALAAAHPASAAPPDAEHQDEPAATTPADAVPPAETLAPADTPPSPDARAPAEIPVPADAPAPAETPAPDQAAGTTAPVPPPSRP